MCLQHWSLPFLLVYMDLCRPAKSKTTYYACLITLDVYYCITFCHSACTSDRQACLNLGMPTVQACLNLGMPTVQACLNLGMPTVQACLNLGRPSCSCLNLGRSICRMLLKIRSTRPGGRQDHVRAVINC